MFIKKYRNEWKYRLNNQELTLLKKRISCIMNIDPHISSKGKYVVHSLYFDDYGNSSLYSVNAGTSERYKWRIRYYDDNLDYIVLEKKEKLDNRCHKKSCRLTLDEYKCITSGNVMDIFYDTSKKLIQEFARDFLIKNYQPIVIIDYERIAYVEQISNVRITFDMKISASYELDKFLDGNYTKFYIQESNYNVLEVKFDGILPSYIRNIVESYHFLQTPFSKYYYGRKIIDTYMF